MLKWPDQVWCAEGVIDNDRKSVFVCNLGDSVNVRNVTVRVAQCLQIDGSGVFLNSSLNFLQVMCIDKGCLDALLGKCVL